MLAAGGLEELCLSRCPLDAPSRGRLSELRALTRLTLNGCGLHSPPPGLSALVNVDRLDLASNPLMLLNIRDSLCHLKRLSWLTIDRDATRVRRAASSPMGQPFGQLSADCHRRSRWAWWTFMT